MKIVNNFKKLWSGDRWFYTVLTAIIILLGQLPIILHLFRNPKGYYYPLMDRVSFSDYYYIALIRFGMGADWLVKIPYVVEEHKASLIQVFFIWLGKLSLLTGIGPAEIFAVFRVLGGMVFVFSAIVLFRIILGREKARWAFLFFLLAQPWPFFNLSKYLFQDFDVWIWHFGEAARRISAMPPHYTFGKGLAVLSLGLFFLFLKKGKSKYLLLTGLLIFMAGIIYPPPVFIVLFSLIITSVFIFARGPLAILQGVLFKNPKYVIFILFYLLMAFLPLVLLKLELAKGYPWDGWQKVELGWNDPKMHFEWDYFSMIWSLVLLSLFSLRKVFNWKNMKWPNLFIFFWAFSAFFLFPLANLLQIGKFRFTEGAQIVPLAILAFWGFEKLLERIKVKFIRKLFLPAFIIFSLFFAVCQVMWSTKRLWPFWANIYFRPEVVEALKYLEKNTKTDAVVLADTYASNFIPAFARVRTIIGFPDGYNDISKFKAEEEAVDKVLRGAYTDEKAQGYMRKMRVGYVYYPIGVYGEKNLYSSFLKKIYKNREIEIYQVERKGK